MSNKEKQKRLKQTMAMLKVKIENIKPHVESSDRINSMYNKMLIEKAIIKNELDNLGKKKIGIIEKISKLIQPKDKKLISDYFRT